MKPYVESVEMTKRTPTPAAFKKWARANKPLAKAVALAQAFAQVERERVDDYVEPLFQSYGFLDDEGKPVTASERSYLVEGDETRMSEFYAKCLVLHAEHGYKGEPETCPALVAENLACKAEQALLDELATFMGLDSIWTTLEQRAKALDLAMTACLGKLK